jgi:hypothetical protein
MAVGDCDCDCAVGGGGEGGVGESRGRGDTTASREDVRECVVPTAE